MMTSNRPEFVAVVHGASKVGVAPVLLNPAWKGLEVDAALGLTSPRFGVGGRRRAPASPASAWARRRSSTSTTPTRPAWSIGPAPRPLPERDVGEDDDAVLVFSSGTTDLPKAVRHTHRSMVLATAHG